MNSYAWATLCAEMQSNIFIAVHDHGSLTPCNTQCFIDPDSGQAACSLMGFKRVSFGLSMVPQELNGHF
jgi:hypothetical protein